MIQVDLATHVLKLESHAMKILQQWKKDQPEEIIDVRGKGLLLLIECRDAKLAGEICDRALELGLFVRQTQGNCIRIMPALTISADELEIGLEILKMAVREVIFRYQKEA